MLKETNTTCDKQRETFKYKDTHNREQQGYSHSRIRNRDDFVHVERLECTGCQHDTNRLPSRHGRRQLCGRMEVYGGLQGAAAATPAGKTRRVGHRHAFDFPRKQTVCVIGPHTAAARSPRTEYCCRLSESSSGASCPGCASSLPGQFSRQLKNRHPRLSSTNPPWT